jgi:hypothetical protein
MPRQESDDGALGIALTAVAGFALGFLGGAVLGGSVGNVHAGRVKGALGRLRRGSKAIPPDEMVHAVREALHGDEATRDLDLEVLAAGEGLVELTGVVADAMARRAAGDIARAVPGVDVVVNRILLQGGDLPPPPVTPASGGR